MCDCVCAYQDAVEELVHKQPQGGGQDVGKVVQELHIHHHGLVSHNEGAVVPHKAHHKHHLIEQLQDNNKQQSDNLLTQQEAAVPRWRMGNVVRRTLSDPSRMSVLPRPRW